jgi:hypothetical protein
MKLAFKGEFPKRTAIVVVVLALLATVVTGREKPSVAVTEPAAKIETKIEAAEDIDVEKLVRREGEGTKADPFAARTFAPEPAAAGAQAPQKPTAPPLPFKYLGKAIENGKLSVFLARGEDSYSVEPGTKIGGEYRVDKVSETAVTFTYLPLKTKQTLDIPAVNP